MKTYTLPPYSNDRLNRAIAASIVLHLFVLAAFAIRAVFLPSEPLIFEDAIRVDIVGLPDKIKQDPLTGPAAKPQTAPAPAPEPAKAAEPTVVTKPAPQLKAPKVSLDKSKPSLDKAKRAQDAAMKRLDAIERLQKMASVQPSSANTNSNTQSVSTSSQIKGNEVSQGNSLSGMQRLEHEAYIGKIHSSIMRNWNVPRWLAKANLVAKFQIYIDSQGYVVKKVVVLSSNNEIFDESAVSAIEASSPLPPPPDSLVAVLAVNGVNIEFDPHK